MNEIPQPSGVPGRLFATGFSTVGPDPEQALSDVGADTLVCLVEDDEVERRFPDFADWIRASPHRVTRLPIPDWGVTDDDVLRRGVLAVADAVRRGDTVVTQCGAGMGRTGVVCTLALVALGASLDDAAAHVRRGRPGAGPDSPEQREQMERVALRLRE